MLDIKILKLFIDAAQTKSINRAAQLNYLSASSVSRAIKTLEEQTNTRLLERSYDGVKLTSQGKEFYGMVEPIIQSMDNLESIYCAREEKADTLRLTVCVHQNSLSYQAVLDFYEKYARGKEYVDVVAAGFLSMNEVINSMQDKFYMLGTIQYNSADREIVYEQLNKNNLTILHENERKIYVSVKENHPLANKEILNVEDLVAYTHLAYIDEQVVPLNYCGNLMEFEHASDKRRILVRERAQIDEVLRATDAYFLGNGDKGVKLLENSRIVCITLDTDLKIMTALICRKDYIMTESAKQYCDILLDLFSKTD